MAQVQRIEAELDDFYVRVPVAGQILKINTRVGEQVNTSAGIVELGRTHQRYCGSHCAYGRRSISPRYGPGEWLSIAP